MVGWHHRFNECELGQTPGDGEGQGGLVCCSPGGHKESDMTQQLNNNKYIHIRTHKHTPICVCIYIYIQVGIYIPVVYCPASPQLFKEYESPYEDLYINVYSSFISKVKSKNWKQPKCPSIAEQINYSVCYAMLSHFSRVRLCATP